MTVHSAKGLEFSAVFVSGLEEGLFPHDNSMLEDGGIEEERRLMYVAITRARKRLYLSYAGSRMLHGQPRYGIVSRFVEEIPPQLCKWIVLPEKQFEARGYNSGVTRRRRQLGLGRRTRARGRTRTAIPPPVQRASFEKPRPDEHPVRHRAERAPCEVRRRRGDQRRGPRARRARAGALRARGHQVARAAVREARPRVTKWGRVAH